METPASAVTPLAAFLADIREAGGTPGGLANETDRMVRIDVDGGVWLKPGAAIAWRGDLRFERRPTLGAGALTEALVREAAPLVRAVGRGRLLCGHGGRHARVVRLAGDAIVIAWPDLLAFEETLAFDAALVGHGLGIAAGGLVALRLAGHGAFAVATHGRPTALRVTPGQAVCTDPHATLAWSAELEPTLRTDVTWRFVVGHGGQEPVQMRFEGTGVVVVQPHKDARPVTFQPLQRVAASLSALA